jgi:protein-tyrosine phosphatase
MHAGEKLYIHCRSGRGRAGTVGACLLGKLYGIGGDEALERVRFAFHLRGKKRRCSPATEEQRDFVRAYCAKTQTEGSPQRLTDATSARGMWRV